MSEYDTIEKLCSYIGCKEIALIYTGNVNDQNIIFKIKKYKNTLNYTLNNVSKTKKPVQLKELKKLFLLTNVNKLPIYVCRSPYILNPSESLYYTGFRVSFDQPEEVNNKYIITMYSPFGEKLKFSTSKENNYSFYHIWLNMKSLELKQNEEKEKEYQYSPSFNEIFEEFKK